LLAQLALSTNPTHQTQLTRLTSTLFTPRKSRISKITWTILGYYTTVNLMDLTPRGQGQASWGQHSASYSFHRPNQVVTSLSWYEIQVELDNFIDHHFSKEAWMLP